MKKTPLSLLFALATLCGALAACSSKQSQSAVPAPAKTLFNGGFDAASAAGPDGWTIDAAVKSKGSIATPDGFPGAQGKVLTLQPNATNGGAQPLGLGQALDPSAWRGQTITISAMLGASDGGSAVIGLHMLGDNGDLGSIQLTQDDSNGVLVRQKKNIAVPQAATLIILYAITPAQSGQAVFDAITVTGSGAAPSAAPAPSGDGQASIVIDGAQVIRQVPATIYGSNVEWINNGQGLWSTSKNTLEPDAVALTRSLNPGLLRFPGGVFSDTYDWRLALAARGARPTSAHYPSGPSSVHNFGIIEMRELAAASGADLLLTVNAGTGTPEMAAEWVRYMNKQNTGPTVRLWEVGNELYMKDDLSGAHLSASNYARRYDAYARAMRAKDPSIRIGAIGGLNYGKYQFIGEPRWTETVLRNATEPVDFLAIHDAYAPVVIGASDQLDPRAVYNAMLAAPVQIAQNLKDVAALLARYEKPQRPIGIAVTEWGPFFHVLPSSPWVDHVKTMGSSLFVSATLNVFLRNPRVEMATFFKLADIGFMGWIGRKGEQVRATAPFEVFKLYRQYLGHNLVQAETRSPTYASIDVGVVAAQAAVPLLDAVATLDGDMLSVIVVNKSETQRMVTALTLKGTQSYGSATVRSIRAAGFDSNTGTTLPVIHGLEWGTQVTLGRFDKGSPTEIMAEEKTLPGAVADVGAGPDQLVNYTFAPLSVTCITFTKVKRG